MTVINNPAIVFRTQEGSEGFNEETYAKHSVLTNVEIDKNFHGLQTSAYTFREEEEARRVYFTTLITEANEEITTLDTESRRTLNNLLNSYRSALESLPQIEHIKTLYTTVKNDYSEKLALLISSGEYYLEESNKDVNDTFGEEGYCNMNIGQQVQTLTIAVERLTYEIEN